MVISPNPTNVDVDNSSLVIGSGANDIVEGSDHCLAVGSGNQILDDSDRSVSFGNNNESVQSDNSMNVGNTNILKYSNNSHIIGQNNQMGDEYPSNTSGFNNSLIIGSDNLLLTDDGSAAPSNGALSFVIGHDNELRHTLQNSFSFGYSISNLGLSSTPHRNDFNIGGDLVGVNQTMTLGYRNDTTLYPTIDRNNGLGETKFVVAVGSSTTTNANALLITEGGISGGGGGTVPMIPRVLLPTVTGFSASNDAAADGLGIPQGALYQNNGILQINRGGGSAVDPLSSYVLKSGDTMTGNLTMNNSQIQITDSGTQARMSINNTGTGDPQINFQLSGSSKFTIGVDNSDSDKFKISGSSALGSNDRIVVNSSGNVGIGTTSPQQKLDVNGNFRINTNNLTLSNTPAWGVPTQNIIGAEDNTNGATLTLMNTSATIPANGVSGTLQFVALDDGRNTGGSGYATASISAVSKLAPGSGQSGQGALVFKTGGYYSNITEKMRIDGLSGNVGIGTTNPVYQLQLSLNSAAKPTSSAWTVVSDERVKTNIRPYETGLQELLQIEPKLFDYNGKAGFDAKTKNNIGVIAQEIKDIMPETVKKYNAKLNEEDKEDTELYNFDSHAFKLCKRAKC